MQSLITRSGLHLPQSLTLMITNKCNLKCLHCWPESGLADNCDHVDRKSLLKMIGDFCQLGIKKICLTGGEPLLHPHWFEILSSSCAESKIKEVCLQTNATLLTQENASRLASVSSHKLTIQVSLEGSQSETHDKIRGSGSFKSTLKGLAFLAKNGLAKRIRVSLTETQDNFQEIPALLKLLHSFGISHFASGTLVHGGRAVKKNGAELQLPTPQQYENILHQYHTDLTFKEHYAKMANIAPLEWYLGQLTPATPGCEFMKNPYVTADGILFPCVMFQIDKYAAHDVYNRQVRQTLQEILPVWAELLQQSRRRSENLKTCKNCPGRSHCHGGCMGRAYTTHGSLMTTEDRCDLRRVVYNWPGCRNSLSDNIS